MKLPVTIAMLAFVMTAWTVGPATDPAVRIPVLVELFTSEGCSSCPPADDLLIKLNRRQPVAGVEAIVLSQHVDYWDRLGWKDPFSNSLFTYRQQVYSNTLKGGRGPYTPQAVIDGSFGFVASDEITMTSALRSAARRPRLTVAVEPRGSDLHVRIGQLTGVSTGDTVEVLLAIAENNLETSIPRGENAGRLIRHDGVVRSLAVIGKLNPAVIPSFAAAIPLKIDAGWKRTALRAVVFAQEKKSRRVLGVASAALQ